MKFNRVFSTEGNSFGGVTFVSRDSCIKSPSGAIIFEHKGLIAPEDWSQNAVDILAQKYMRKAGVPEYTKPKDVSQVEYGLPIWLAPSEAAPHTEFGRESDAREVFKRLAGAWTYQAWIGGYFESCTSTDLKRDGREDSARIFMDEICTMLALQMFAPNSPQWFNTGLWWRYGIEAHGQELFRVNPSSFVGNRGHSRHQATPGNVNVVTEAYCNPLVYACFIQSVEDKLVGDGSILDLTEREAKVFKFGGGSGTNFATIRGLGEPLTAGGTSSGLMSFLPAIDRFSGAIKSGGSTRRAARMVMNDIDHPDIFDFVTWKVREEDKVAMLSAGSILAGNHANAILAAAKDGSDPLANPKLKKAVAKAIRDGVPGPYIRRLLGLAAEGVISAPVPVFDCDWQGEAYRTVTGQNGNNTVRITDYFMTHCDSDVPHELIWRTEKEKAKLAGRLPKPCRTVEHRELWGAIIDSAWKCADPGAHFSGTVAEWHMTPADGEIRASNPCSEYLYVDDNGCNLASLNLVTFMRTGEVAKACALEVLKFNHATRIVTTILDITVGMSSFPSAKIAMNSHNHRTLGLGYCNVGGLLMRSGIAYDSNEGREICAAITCLMHSTSLSTSAEIAGELGSFPRFDGNRENILRVVGNHLALANPSLPTVGISKGHHQLNLDRLPGGWKEVGECAKLAAKRSLREIDKNGLRNAQVTNVAPTGTIGILMDADTTGIEPDFALVKFKTLAGGGYMKIANQGIDAGLKSLGYSATERAEIITYVTGRGTFTGCPSSGKLATLFSSQISEFNAKAPTAVDVRHISDGFEKILTAAEITAVNEYVCGTGTIEGAPYVRPEHLAVFDCANPCGTGKRSIDWPAHIKMVSAAQSWISGGISKTINLPAKSTRKDVADAYKLAWQSGVKCIALYRDDSKLSQPLSKGDPLLALEGATEEVKAVERIITKIVTNRRPLPDRRAGYTQKARVGKHKLYLRTGEYEDGTLGEIFLDLHKEGAAFRSMMGAFCIAVSLGLQHGVPLDEFVDKFTFMRFEPNGPVQHHPRLKNATSIVDFIFRDLAITYLGRDDLAHVSAADLPPSLDSTSEESDIAADVARASENLRPKSEHVKVSGPLRGKIEAKRSEARAKGYTGNFCPVCGNNAMTQNGPCEKCEICGESSSCS